MHHPEMLLRKRQIRGGVCDLFAWAANRGFFFFSSRRRHTRYWRDGVQTCALPIFVDGALTVVVSPLIALMRDQVRQMASVGVPAATLNSMATEEEAQEAWRLLRSGELRLLFVSPERLMADGLTARLKELGVRRLAIDEAHCVSQWGHDFRPEYREIARVRAALGDVQTIALTATADQTTREDIV